MLRQVFKRTGAVALGTAAGQAVVLLSTPLLARLHDPREFGALALLLSLSNIGTATACFRYDIAIPSVQDRDALPLVRVSLAFSLAVAILIASATLLLERETWFVSRFGVLVTHPFLVGTCIFLVGSHQATIALLLQRAEITKVAWLRFIQGAAFGGFAMIPFVGLLWAQALSFVGGLFGIRRAMQKREKDEPGFRATAVEFRAFPLMSLPGAILDVVGYSVCVWAIVNAYGSSVAGHYSQIQRLIGAPLMLLSMSLAQILLKQTADISSEKREVRRLLRKVLLVMALLSGCALIVLWFIGQPLISLVLGPKWDISRSLIIPVAIAVFARACVSPLSSVLITYRRFGYALAWQGAYFFSAVFLLSYVSLHLSFVSFLHFYAAHEVVFYVAYLLLIGRTLRDQQEPPDFLGPPLAPAGPP
ncbi:MAG TPA: oligosaccharide flippase family protein [Opitutaceae bacterium]|nr:oligosaccharide flippase family protein [Opitutaceae bacterium]